MLIGAAVWQFVLAIHILAVIVAFGVLFVYPLLAVIGVRLEPRSMPWFHRLQWAVHTRLQAPGLGVVVLAGIYLASDLHDWGDFFVAWGIAVSVVIGGVGGAYISPREKRLAALAEAEVATLASSGADRPPWSDEYRTTRREADRARMLQLVLTIVTVFFMALQLG
jgi:hypothetical protein